MKNNKTVRLLIVEDNEKQVKLYKDTIEDYNSDYEMKIKSEISRDLEEASDKIKNIDFDAAIIDLRLGGDDIEGRGKDIIRKIKRDLRFPVFVVTAYPGDLDEDLMITNIFYKVYELTKKETIEILKEIVDIYKTGITKIMGGKGIIEKTLQKVFWESIAENMEYWKMEVKNEKRIEKVLSRHILAYLNECLHLTDEGVFEKCHPAEVYIIPPVKRDFFTGDILISSDPEEYFLILTPACDMELRKQSNCEELLRNAEKIILAKLIEFIKVDEVASYIENPSNEKKNRVKSYMKNKKGRYHYLPSFGAKIPGFLIDFQNINKITVDQLMDFSRIASVNETFLKDIIVRFTSYYARQGSPDLDIDAILENLLND